MNISEDYIIQELKRNFIFHRIKCVRTNNSGYECNVYHLGIDEQTNFGELDFSKKNVIYRLSYYKNGLTYYKSGYLNSEKDVKDFIEFIRKFSINGEKVRKIDELKEELRREFED